ncbi:MAG: hypothetical protein JWN34_2901 [Bryobacterales bacterium]|nr:hypothetical protein [Bryobacterales bacterium]
MAAKQKEIDESAIRKSQIEYLARERAERNRHVVGKCFQRRNWYGEPKTGHECWYLYMRAVGVNKDGNIVMSEFETDTRGNTTFRERSARVSAEGLEEISVAKYKEELDRALKRLMEQSRQAGLCGFRAGAGGARK